MATAAGLIADLEAGLAAAKELASKKLDPITGELAKVPAPVIPPVEAPAPVIPPVEADTSMMPGGVDSAPVSGVDEIEHAVENEAVDIIGELKSGTSISDVANKLLDENGLHSIVKAIGTLAERIL